MATRKVAKKGTTATAPKGKAKAAATKKASVTGEKPMSALVMELIHGRKHTDEEIHAAVVKAYPNRKPPARIAADYRKMMNEGKKERQGYPAPKRLYAEVGAAAAAPKVPKKPARVAAPGAASTPRGTARTARRARK